MPGAGRSTLAGIIDRTPQHLPPPRQPAGVGRYHSGRILRPEPALMTTPYDAAWKLLFSFPVMPHDLLAEFVPRAWTAKLDIRALEHRSGSQVSNGLSQRHQDCVWEVGCDGRPGSVLVALEFQSTVDSTMAVRMLVYTALLYQGRLRKRESPGKKAPRDKRDPLSEQEPPADQSTPPDQDRPDRRESPHGEAPADNPPEPLPPVLPIVLYHGKPQWTAKEDMAGVCAPPTESLAPYQPEQRYLLLDLRRCSAPLPEGTQSLRDTGAPGAEPVPGRGSGRGRRAGRVVARGGRARESGARVLGMDGIRSRPGLAPGDGTGRYSETGGRQAPCCVNR